MKISKEENSDSEALIEALKNGNRALKEHNTSLEQRNSNLEEAQLKLTRKLGEANRKLSNLSEDCTKKQATVEQLNGEIAHLTTIIKDSADNLKV